MTLDWVGWAGLTPDQQTAGIVGGGVGLVVGWFVALRMLFAGLPSRRKKKRKKRKRGRR